MFWELVLYLVLPVIGLPVLLFWAFELWDKDQVAASDTAKRWPR